jgi:hypothetical protein
MDFAQVMAACQQYAEGDCKNFPPEAPATCRSDRDNPDTWCGVCLMKTLLEYESVASGRRADAKAADERAAAKAKPKPVPTTHPRLNKGPRKRSRVS